ncbi:hypothetical protein MJO28_010814 [Puccinia striiformis f. sp. tritici]|uniref:Uncharacterized protein n=1 Tax=Puccinia striiformis f. sp. tritici TaxID=168172 RepID=A0ACC0E5I5_9BASI|nr:hypothetical protein MJO28_010814 [Puccinia striiformis f. sp. tritici]
MCAGTNPLHFSNILLSLPPLHQFRLEVSKLTLPLTPPLSPPSDHTGLKLNLINLTVPILFPELIKPINTHPPRWSRSLELKRRSFWLSILQEQSILIFSLRQLGGNVHSADQSGLFSIVLSSQSYNERIKDESISAQSGKVHHLAATDQKGPKFKNQCRLSQDFFF